MSEEKKKFNLIKQFDKLFSAKINTELDEKLIPDEEQKMYLDKSNVVAIIPLKKWAKDFLLTNFDVTENNVATLSYYVKSEECKSRYGSEFINVVLNICKEYHYFDLETRKDYPLRITTDDFILIVAPRRNDD